MTREERSSPKRHKMEILVVVVVGAKFPKFAGPYSQKRNRVETWIMPTMFE